jgi:hypothetical protein
MHSYKTTVGTSGKFLASRGWLFTPRDKVIRQLFCVKGRVFNYAYQPMELYSYIMSRNGSPIAERSSITDNATVISHHCPFPKEL